MWVFVAVLVYVLSVGPAERLYTNGILPSPLHEVYYPLWLAAEECGWFDKILLWYVHDVWHAKSLPK
jgi:hypothetical protein